MWHTLRFCSSQAYISRVHGFVNDSASTCSTPSRSTSPARGSMRNGTLLTGSGIARELGVGASYVQGPYGIGRRTMAAARRIMRDQRHRPREERRDRPGDDRTAATGGANECVTTARAITDEQDRGVAASAMPLEHRGRKLDRRW